MKLSTLFAGFYWHSCSGQALEDMIQRIKNHGDQANKSN